MPYPTLRCVEVTKQFADRRAVDRLDFEVEPGEIFALLGPKGAGKTTLVRMLVGILRPDSGRIEVRVEGTVASRLPPTSLPALPVRFLLSDPGAGEVALAWASLVLAVALTRRLAGKIFEIGMLLYGKEPTLAEILRWARSPESRHA
ncbi:MAG: ATP-binding cassette domain-containing protein [Thermoanaerobaculia bacterium]|nr:ATP-binding cassette domain-containing protein [Thermoanaerobaculia bacterium]